MLLCLILLAFVSHEGEGRLTEGPCVISQSRTCNNVTTGGADTVPSQEVIRLLGEVLDIVSGYAAELRQYRRLYNKLERIRKQQIRHDVLTRTVEERLANVPSVQEWCKSSLNGSSIAAIPGMGLGLVADRDIQKGQIMSVLDLTDSITSFEAETLLKQFKRLTVPKNSKFEKLWHHHLLLALYICSLRLNTLSRWAEYLDILPTTFDMPHHLDPEAMAYLDNGAQSYAIWSVYDMTLTYDLFRWAFLTSLTRAYLDDKGVMIFPCWDIANHGPVSLLHTRVKYTSKAAFKSPIPQGQMIASAERDIAKGEQVVHSYNDMDSTVDHFFNTWGILEPSGAQYVLVELRSGNPLYRVRRALLSTLNVNIYGQWIHVTQQNKLPLNVQDYNYLVAMATARKSKLTLTQNAWRKTWRLLSRSIQKHKRKLQPESELRAVLNQIATKKSATSKRTAILLVLAEHEALSRMRSLAVDLVKQAAFEVPTR